jgi:hypothetical protein
MPELDVTCSDSVSVADFESIKVRSLAQPNVGVELEPTLVSPLPL